MSLARVSLGLVLLGSVGCATMRPVHDPAGFIAQNHPPMVYITYTDNSSVPVTAPRVSGDSLYGSVAGSDSVAVPLHDVSVVQAKQHDKTRTVLLISGITAGTAAAIYAFAQQIGNSACTGQGFHAVGGETGSAAVNC
jgi:hypothetical protein